MDDNYSDDEKRLKELEEIGSAPPSDFLNQIGNMLVGAEDYFTRKGSEWSQPIKDYFEKSKQRVNRRFEEEDPLIRARKIAELENKVNSQKNADEERLLSTRASLNPEDSLSNQSSLSPELFRNIKNAQRSPDQFEQNDEDDIPVMTPGQYQSLNNQNDFEKEEANAPSSEKKDLSNKKIEQDIDKELESQQKEKKAEESYAKDLKAAQRRASILSGIGTANEGAEIAAAALTGLPKSPTDKSLESYGQQLVKNVSDLEKARQVDEAKKLEKELKDPKSKTSKQAREMFKGLFPNRNIPDNMTAEQIQKLAPTLINDIMNQRNIEMQEKRLVSNEKRAELNELYRRSKEDKKARLELYRQARLTLNQDPRLKNSMDKMIAFENVDNLLEQVRAGNKTAIGGLGTQLARAMGEVGVLTDADVVRYLSRSDWGGKVLDWWNKGAEGDLSDSTALGIQKSIDALKGVLKKNISKVYNNAANRLKAGFPDFDDKTIKGILGSPGFDVKSSENNSQKTQSDKVKITKNGQVGMISKSNLQKALDDGWEIQK